jgi:hypothetical protein
MATNIRPRPPRAAIVVAFERDGTIWKAEERRAPVGMTGIERTTLQDIFLTAVPLTTARDDDIVACNEVIEIDRSTSAASLFRSSPRLLRR